MAYSQVDGTPVQVNVSHPLWVQTSAQLEGFTNEIDASVFDVPAECYN